MRVARFLGLAAGWLLSLGATGQSIQLSRYLDQEEFRPHPDLFAYREIYVRWQMAGKVQAFLNEGITSLQEGELNAAEHNLKQATALDPSLAPAHYYLGVCHKVQLKFDLAEAELLSALKYNDTLAAAHLELGEIYEVVKDTDKALKAYTLALDLSPRLADACFHLANFHFAQDRFAKAEKYYEQTLGIDDTFDEAYVMLGRLTLVQKKPLPDALRYFQLAVKADSASREGLLWRGLIYAELGEPDKSFADWSSLVRYYPNQPFFLYMRGYLQIETGDLDNAFADFRRAITAVPENSDKFVGGQTILDKRIDLQSAARVLIKKLYGFKEPELTYIKNGFCFLLAMRYQGAINWFMKVNTPSGIVSLLRGLTFEHAGLHERALAEYNQAIALDPELLDAYKKRAIYQMEMDAYPGAIADINEMIRLDPESMFSYKLRGIARAVSGYCTEAIPDLTRFIETDSTDRESFKTRAYCYEKNQQWREAGTDYLMAFHLGQPDQTFLVRALDNMQKVLAATPEDHLTRFYFGSLLYDGGYRDEGIRQLQQASKKGNLKARELLKRLKP